MMNKDVKIGCHVKYMTISGEKTGTIIEIEPNDDPAPAGQWVHIRRDSSETIDVTIAGRLNIVKEE